MDDRAKSLFKFSHSHSFIFGMCDKQDFPLWDRSIDGPKMMVIRVCGSDNKNNKSQSMCHNSMHVSCWMYPERCIY